MDASPSGVLKMPAERRDAKGMKASWGANPKQLARMRSLMLEQMIYFLTEAGHPRSEIKSDLIRIMKMPAGKAPRTKAPMLPLESLHYGEVLSAWANRPEYSDSAGSPAMLPFSTTKKGAVSFSKLCRELHPSLRPTRILNELKRYGAVSELAPNELSITQNYLRLNRKDRESAMYSVKVLADLLHTMTLNRKKDSGLFQRSAWTDTLDGEYLDQFKLLVREQGLDFLTFIDNRMMEHDVRRHKEKRTRRDGAKGGKRRGVRATVGVYMTAG